MYVWCVSMCGAHKYIIYVYEAYMYTVCIVQVRIVCCVWYVQGLCATVCGAGRRVSIVFECGTYGMSMSVWGVSMVCVCECGSRVCLWVSIWLCVVHV